MKKVFIKGILMVLAVAFVATIYGCNSANPEISHSATQPPVTQSPNSPADSSSPSPSPSSRSDRQRLADPETSDDEPDDEPYYDEYEYEFFGIFFMEYYYLDGDDSLLGLYFWDDGEVDLDDSDGSSIYGEYDVDDDTIIIYVDGEEVVELLIIDCATLLDWETGEIYALEGALDNELEISEYYYLDGDETAGSLWFWDDGEVDIEDYYGDIEVGTYDVYGVTIVIELDGDEVELYIINSYILESEYGDIFIRVP